MQIRRRLAVGSILSMLVAGLAGLQPISASAAVTQVSMTTAGCTAPFCFSPATTTVAVGAVVRWTNSTSAPHTATEDTGLFDTAIVNPLGTASVTLSTPGTFHYHCAVHPYMHGTVVVVKEILFNPTTSSPQYVTTGPDGNLWVTDGGNGTAGAVHRVTPGGADTSYPTLTATGLPSEIVSGPGGNLWVLETGSVQPRLAKVTTAGNITEYPVSAVGGPVAGLAVGSDGNLWFNDRGAFSVGRVTPTGTVTEFPVPGPAATQNPIGIAAGPDGSLWVTDETTNAIWTVTTAGGFLKHPLSTPNVGAGSIVAGPDGALWFAESSAHKIGRINTAGTISEFSVPTASNYAGLSVGPDGNIWFSEGTANNVAFITMSGAVSEYALPTANTLVRGTARGPDGNEWFVESNAGRIGYLRPPSLLNAAVLPAMANAAYGGYTTAVYAQNNGSAATATALVYLDVNGAVVGTGDFNPSLPANAAWTARQDSGHAFPPGGAGSALLLSTQPVSAFVNEFAPNNQGDGSGYAAIGLRWPGSPVVGTSATLFAPAIAKGAYGGYTTGIGLVNAGTAVTDIVIDYRDPAGTTVKTQTLAGVAPHAYRDAYSGDPALGLAAGFAGTAVIRSSAGQPLAAVVNEVGPGGQFSSYDAETFASSILHVPAALRNAYGGFNTGFGIQNTTDNTGTVSIAYYDSAGSVAATTSYPIAARGYLGVYQGTDLPSAGAYSATITTTPATVSMAAIVNEVAPAGLSSAGQSTAFNALPFGAFSVNLPLVESAGPDGWSTGEGIINIGGAATTVTVTYFNADTGAPIGTPQALALQPNAFWGLYQPAGGLPNGARATAQVSTSGGGIAVICNETSASSFMSYNAVRVVGV